MTLRTLRSRLSPRRSDRVAFLHHRLSGSPVPPPHRVKRFWLARLARRHGCRTLIETGTYQGDMVDAMLPVFRRIVTIELDPGLAEAAVRRFRERPEVTVIHGDAGQVLERVLSEVDERFAFWLDGHYSGPGTALGARPTPILAELEAIGRHHRKDHLILIDDARCFGNEEGYPALARVVGSLRAIHAGYRVVVRDDMIQALPAQRHGR